MLIDIQVEFDDELDDMFTELYTEHLDGRNLFISDLNIPEPYPLQKQIMEHPSKRKVVVAGRRAGKTTMAAMMLLDALLDGKKAQYSATTQDQSDAVWDYLMMWSVDKLEQYGFWVNRQKRIIDGRMVRNGDGKRYGKCRVKTGSEPNSLRGEGVHLLILDECAFLKEAIVDKVGLPMLLDHNGTLVLIGTPDKRNWFYDRWSRGEDDLDERWKSWRFTSYANPHLDAEALLEIVEDLTDDGYKQEILAHFLDNAGQLFRNIAECTYKSKRKPIPDHTKPYVFGIDLGRHKDFTVITVFDVLERKVVHIERFNQIDWTTQRARVVSLYETWKPMMIVGEMNSFGEPNMEELLKAGLPIEGFTTTNSSKKTLIDDLILGMETQSISIPDNDQLKNELQSFEYSKLPSGLTRYAAASGKHDDMVISLALAYRAARVLPTWLASRETYTWDIRARIS